MELVAGQVVMEHLIMMNQVRLFIVRRQLFIRHHRHHLPLLLLQLPSIQVVLLLLHFQLLVLLLLLLLIVQHQLRPSQEVLACHYRVSLIRKRRCFSALMMSSSELQIHSSYTHEDTHIIVTVVWQSHTYTHT